MWQPRSRSWSNRLKATSWRRTLSNSERLCRGTGLGSTIPPNASWGDRDTNLFATNTMHLSLSIVTFYRPLSVRELTTICFTCRLQIKTTLIICCFLSEKPTGTKLHCWESLFLCLKEINFLLVAWTTCVVLLIQPCVFSTCRWCVWCGLAELCPSERLWASCIKTKSNLIVLIILFFREQNCIWKQYGLKSEINPHFAYLLISFWNNWSAL